MNVSSLFRSAVLASSLILFYGCAHSDIPLDLAAEQMTDDAADETAAAAEENEAEIVPLTESDGEDGSITKNVSLGAGEKKTVLKKKEIGDDQEALLDGALELTDAAQEYWKDNDMDRAFESLDQAYALVLKVPNSPKFTQQKEDLRFMISKRILEMHASRSMAVKGSHNAIPLVINDHVKREIQSFQTVERNFFLESYRRSGRFRADMAKALKDAGIPEEISWLPLIESGFKTRALSRARAFGLWQFIPSTGYKFGLKRNDWVDERLDPEKATAAAIAYMKELHQMFGDWATVLAAYNCGEGAVARVIRSQKINYLDNFWDFYERLPRETARYYPRFLAVLAIVKDPAQYGFTLDELDKPLPYETVTIERPVHLKSIAEQMGIELEHLTALNPELRRDATPGTSYALKVPPGKGEAVLAAIEKMPKYSPPRIEYVVHRVKRGETLSVIALRYRTSMTRIREANNLRTGNMLRIGQRLKIPTRGSSSTT
ncbi:MAG: hypothetical protein A2078_03550 [Nitrospirae bacterium GWC2_57_9]|nr:MAG: hypothetical protein A2078_03550 [Nitrospirae bacterium GWC2_57_9]